jgi:V/A-type H+/Na+-transporting ATPase subunit F
MDVAALGNEEFVIGFRLGGVKRTYVCQADMYEKTILELIADPTIGVLTIDSNDIDKMSPTTRKKVMESIAPVVVMIGSKEGDLREKVKRAIGVDLYKA